MLTIQEVADLLGFKPATIKAWAEQGKLPAYRIGNRLRFRESELVAWLEQQRLCEPGHGPDITHLGPQQPLADPVA
jgi:excisionase family DNA binding protein